MPLAPPPEAGRVLFSLPRRSSFSPLMLATLGAVLALDALLLRSPWLFAFLVTAAYVLGFVVLYLRNARQPHLASVCENGLVVQTRGDASYVDWRDLASVASFETISGRHYDVNVNGATYRLTQHTVGKKLLKEVVDTIVQRSRFQWITDTLAARPDILERYRPTRVQPKA